MNPVSRPRGKIPDHTRRSCRGLHGLGSCVAFFIHVDCGRPCEMLQECALSLARDGLAVHSSGSRRFYLDCLLSKTGNSEGDLAY